MASYKIIFKCILGALFLIHVVSMRKYCDRERKAISRFRRIYMIGAMNTRKWFWNTVYLYVCVCVGVRLSCWTNFIYKDLSNKSVLGEYEYSSFQNKAR